MSFEQMERQQAVLRYAASVPEWSLALKHQAAADLAKCASRLMAVSQMMLATDAADRLDPGRFDYGLAPNGYAKAISDAEYSLGDGAVALAIIAALADESEVFPLISIGQTGGLDDAMSRVQAGYNSRFGQLAERCRMHGMKEAEQHG